MNFGFTPEEFAEVQKKIILPLEKVGAKVWIFGSRAREEHSQYSDLDIMIESKKNIDPLISEIKELFENSNFPYKIDIVDQKNFASSYIKNYLAERKKWPSCK